MDTDNNGDVQNTALATSRYVTRLNLCAQCMATNSLQNKCSFTENSRYYKQRNVITNRT